MKNEPNNQQESLWRRPLSATERAAVRGRPDLELEARLTDTLAQIPDAPVPSNFTARVLNGIEFEEKQATRSRGWDWNWRLLWPRVTVAAAVLFFAGVSVQRYEANSHRIQLAKNVAQLAAAQPLPSMDVLENLPAIQRMSQPAHADTELLAAFQ